MTGLQASFLSLLRTALLLTASLRQMLLEVLTGGTDPGIARLAV
jgi:hypothetical protein